jgi:dolichol-phosphate mannosyltransferase
LTGPGPTISLVLPTYDERENVEILIPQVAEVFDGEPYEIVVVDDRSPDGTGDAVLRLAASGHPARLVTKERREGIGAALRLGYTESRGDLIASMDADLSFDPADLLRLVACVRDGADLVVGTRHGARSSYEAPTREIRVKRLVSMVGNRILRAVTGIPLTDFSGNFRALRRDVWNAIETTENTNALLFEMILKTYVRGFALAEVPVTFHDRRYGRSKLRLGREIPRFLRSFLRHVWRHREELRRRRSAARARPS